MRHLEEHDEQPINLEESSSTELKRVVVTEDAQSSSTLAPVWVPKPHPEADRRELHGQPFNDDHAR